MDPQSSGNMWDTAYIYKGLDSTVGWAPRKSAIWWNNFYINLEGMHMLTGVVLQACSGRPCVPKYLYFTVRNVTLTRGTEFDTHDYSYKGPDEYGRPSAQSTVSIIL